jgi:hypothetical protein
MPSRRGTQLRSGSTLYYQSITDSIKISIIIANKGKFLPVFNYAACHEGTWETEV